MRIGKSIINDLPTTPGVYLFFGAAGELLYVGKSKNIRTRVRSHFSSPEERDLCRQVCHLEARQTAGELGALLLESRLIKELRPLYNIRARQKRRMIIARKSTTHLGYFRVVLEAIEQIDPSHTSPLMAIFKTRTQAKEYLATVAKSHRLCPKLLGLENTKRYCFSFHLGLCGGACMGVEDARAYNIRFDEAFAERRIKAWPYTGGIIIEEKAEERHEGEVFIVDNWCLLYSFTYAEDKYELRIRGTHRFDYDGYKILCRYIFDDGHEENIRHITSGEIEAFVHHRLRIAQNV